MYYRNPAFARAVNHTAAELEMLAKTCAHQARLSRMASEVQDAAVGMWHMAKEYQYGAAKFNGGILPDIGEESVD